VTDEQIRLYALARIVTPTETRIRTFAEKAAGGILYTLELKTPYGTLERWFAVHSSSLRALPDGQVAGELRRAIGPPALPDLQE
jgi:hypothetical protein